MTEMKTKFAQNTSVSTAKTRAEIEDLILKAGGSRFGTATDTEAGKATVFFVLAGRQIMFELELPKVDQFATKKVGRWRRTVPQSPEAKSKAWEQACRTAWRSLLLAVKSKLVAVENGIETFDEAFMAQIVVADDNGRAIRFGHLATKAIADSYVGGRMPPLLGAGGPQR